MENISSIDKIIIIDFGSQTTQLIARRIRELGVYCEIISCFKSNEINYHNSLKGIILSGGPLSITKNKYVGVAKKIFDFNIPVFGICYGHQLIARFFGGIVKNQKKSEFGKSYIYKNNASNLTKNFFIAKNHQVWMSHTDVVKKLPSGFREIGLTDQYKYSIIENRIKKIYGVQFHPEVIHTQNGKVLFKNFIFDICKCKKNWRSKKKN